jgi:hypothetical protein
MTEFEHFVCWQRDRTFVVLNPDAEHIDDDVFLATHTDLPLTLQETSPESRPGLPMRRWTMDVKEFLDQFLSTDRKHMQVVVLGDAGSGKSHLIHWLALNIPDSPSRRVLSIPRSGLSLRGVVERILDELPSGEQAKYREQLDRTGFHVATPEVQRSRLLAEIAIAIEADEPRDEAEEVLQEGLPHLFRDPNYADYLQVSGGIVDDLVAHIGEPRPYERRDQRRSFDVGDLPLEAVNIGQLAARTRSFMSELRGNPEFVEPAIAVINRNLDRAIGQVLNFTGDQLIDLMRDVRRALRRKDMSLVLLIEDFARVQGIDYPLLQALIESAAASDDLCEVRWAMAMTTGYYGRTVDTVRTRMDFVIDMNLSTHGQVGAFDEDKVAGFASRYLNAVRVDPTDLQEWRAGGRGGELPGPPNPCTPCVFRPQCHQAFGEVDGVGLYPFNRAALLEMTRRVDPNFDDRFNPRMLIMGVLAEVLGNRLHEFDSHAFPSERFLESMRGTSLQPVEIEKLQRAAPDHAPRQLAVLELWGTPGALTEVNRGIYEAFAMPPPDIDGLAPVVSTGHPAPVVTETSRATDPIVDAIRAWGRGQPFAELYAPRLRDLVYAAVVGYVDWDGEGLQQSWAASKSGATPFRARSIIFQGQVSSPRSQVILRIPESSDQAELRQAAIALEGLWQFQRAGAWSFSEADLKLISVRRCLELWSGNVTAQLRETVRIDGGDLVDQAIAILAIGVALAGGLEDDRPSITKLSNAIFEDWPPDSPAESEAWRRLYREVRRSRDSLVALVRAWSSGGKGGQVGAFLDGARLARATTPIRAAWRVDQVQAPGDDASNALVPQLLNRIAQDLPMAAQEELDRIRDWATLVNRHAPDGPSGRALQGVIAKARQAASDAGLQVPRALQDALDQSLENFGPVLYDRGVEAARRLADGPEMASSLPSIASLRLHKTMEATRQLLAAADRYIDQVEASLATREGNQEQRSADVDRDRRRIDGALNRLTAALEGLEATT